MQLQISQSPRVQEQSPHWPQHHPCVSSKCTVSKPMGELAELGSESAFSRSSAKRATPASIWRQIDKSTCNVCWPHTRKPLYIWNYGTGPSLQRNGSFDFANVVVTVGPSELEIPMPFRTRAWLQSQRRHVPKGNPRGSSVHLDICFNGLDTVRVI